MTPEEFAHGVQAAAKEPLLLLVGTDAALAEWALDAVRQQADFDEERVGSGPQQLREATTLALTPSWFLQPRLVVAWGVEVLSGEGGRDRQPELAALEAYLEAAPGDARLVLWAAAADRRLAAVRRAQVRGALLEVAPPPPREYPAWVEVMARRQGATLTPEARRAFVESGLDLMALRAAIAVAALAGDEGAPVQGEVARWAAPPGGELRVFALTDAFLQRDRGQVSVATARLLAQGESPLGLLGLLARQLRLLVRAQALLRRGTPAKELGPQLGAHPFVAQKLAQALPRWSDGDLRSAFRALRDLDLRLKSGSPQAVAFDIGLQRLLRSAQR